VIGCSCGKRNEEIILLIREKMEYAYFEGQKDALEGRVRVLKTHDGKYIWNGSPWMKLRIFMEIKDGSM